jgi:predicted acetyltransferase
MMRNLFGRLGLTSAWSVEVAAAVLALLGGIVLMPLLIFYAGVGSLGRYEGAGLGHFYSDFFSGLRQASMAYWVVALGPYGLYLLFKGLRTWWRAGARLA